MADHDLRTPLASMQAMLKAIEDGLVEPEHYLPTLREQVRTLSTLVDDLFEAARIDAGVLSLDQADPRLFLAGKALLHGAMITALGFISRVPVAEKPPRVVKGMAMVDVSRALPRFMWP